MANESTTSFTSPFESGEWAGWRNVDRRNWLRAFAAKLKEKQKHIETQFKLDKKKMKRLADALKMLESTLQEELAISDKALAYLKAVGDLGMDEMLKIESQLPLKLFDFGDAKPVKHNGN